MGTEHIVVQGEFLAAIARMHGFLPDTIWNHPDNSELRSTRKSPNTLFPGDKTSKTT